MGSCAYAPLFCMLPLGKTRGGLLHGIATILVTTITDWRSPCGCAMPAVSQAVWWEKNAKISLDMTQVVSVLTTAMGLSIHFIVTVGGQTCAGTLAENGWGEGGLCVRGDVCVGFYGTTFQGGANAPSCPLPLNETHTRLRTKNQTFLACLFTMMLKWWKVLFLDNSNILVRTYLANISTRYSSPPQGWWF